MVIGKIHSVKGRTTPILDCHSLKDILIEAMIVSLHENMAFIQNDKKQDVACVEYLYDRIYSEHIYTIYPIEPED